MNILKHTVSLLCALALFLSIAPMAFAEKIVDEENNIELFGDDDLHITSSGSITVETDREEAVVGSCGDVLNEGIITASSKNGDATTVANKNLINKNQITVETDNGRAGVYSENMLNEGIITASSKSFQAVVEACENLTNKNQITVTCEDGDRAVVQVGSELCNDGIIMITSTGSDGQALLCDIDEDGIRVVNNAGKIIEITGEQAVLLATEVENYGDITLTGKQVFLVTEDDEAFSSALYNGESYLAGDEAIKNYGTITIVSEDENINGTYYGVNYVDKDGILSSLLEKWTDGREGNTFEQTVDFQVGTKEGYNFGGWQLSDGSAVYQLGDTVSFTIGKTLSLIEIWEAIINADPHGPSGYEEHDQKPVEHIIQHVEGMKVLDADRREMEAETDYLAVAKTSFNRLIVLFSWEQMTQMEKGEHLFYIVDQAGAETEYVLTIG